MIQLSVITPVFNSVQFIESCIQNVIAQKCPLAEHIIVDGGSTDGTREIIERYALHYKHIHWISEKDNGQSDAMNKGLQMARGEIIGFLNADDMYGHFTLNRILEIMLFRKEYDFIAGNCKAYDLEGRMLFIIRPRKLKPYHLFSYAEPFPINPASYFYRKKIHDAVGIYSLGNDYNMDYEFILKASLKFNFMYFNEDWGYIIQHSGAKTIIDSVNNELEARKRAIYLKLYKECPGSIRLKSNLYRIYKKFLKRK